MVSYNRKERKLIQKYLAKNINELNDKQLAKELRNKVFDKYKVDFISGNGDRLSRIFRDNRILEIGVKAYILI